MGKERERERGGGERGGEREGRRERETEREREGGEREREGGEGEREREGTRRYSNLVTRDIGYLHAISSGMKPVSTCMCQSESQLRCCHVSFICKTRRSASRMSQ